MGQTIDVAFTSFQITGTSFNFIKTIHQNQSNQKPAMLQ